MFTSALSLAAARLRANPSRPARVTALGLIWRFGDPKIGSGRLGGVEVQRAAAVQLVEALAVPEFREGTLR